MDSEQIRGFVNSKLSSIGKKENELAKHTNC